MTLGKEAIALHRAPAPCTGARKKMENEYSIALISKIQTFQAQKVFYLKSFVQDRHVVIC